ncbi:MAG: ABC transporter ATP-binding protein [Anaerolineae bacterium]|nr:ABC transporter ATP-binding protein [Anaerolineae bacterium]
MNTPTESDLATHPVADMRWLQGYVLRYRWAALWALLCGAIGGLAAAIEPYLVALIVDRLEQGVVLEDLVNYGILMIGAAIVAVIAFFGQRYYSGQVAYFASYDIRRDLFENLLLLDQAFFRANPTGDLISRMYIDLDMIWRLLTIGFTRFSSAFVTLIVALVLLGTVSPSLTLVVFIVLFVSTAFQVWAGLALSPVFERVQDQAGNLSTLVQDAFSGIQTIKTYAQESGVARAFARENAEYRRRWLYFKRRNEPVGMLPNMISELTAGVVVVVGGVFTLQGTLTLGDFVQFLIYLAMISTVLLQLGTIYQRYQQTRGALTRLTLLLQRPQIKDSDQREPTVTPCGEIRFEKVGVREGDKWLLQDINLTIAAGQTIALVGPTGCGKSLLVNLLARVSDPDEGRILIDGRDIRTIPLNELRAMLAFVPQSTFLFSQPVHANIRMGSATITDDDLTEAIHISRLSNDLPQLPQGLDTLVGEKGVMLSGGQKQRVAIARALVREPVILVLDDALSSVDTRTSADILADLRQVLRSRTSIIIAHRMATVKDADFIVVMESGHVVESGSHAQLVERGGLYSAMVSRELSQETAVSYDLT